MSNPTMSANEQAMQDVPEFAEALASQASGEYKTTLFEMWDLALGETIKGFEQPLSMQWCDSILRGWPWLTYADLPNLKDLHLERLKAARETIRECYPKPAKFLFKENVGDWEKHRDAYIDTMVAVTRMDTQWSHDWLEIPFDSPLKAIDAVSITIAHAMFMGEGNFINQVEYLAGFEISDEEGEEIAARMAEGFEEVSDD